MERGALSRFTVLIETSTTSSGANRRQWREISLEEDDKAREGGDSVTGLPGAGDGRTLAENAGERTPLERNDVVGGRPEL